MQWIKWLLVWHWGIAAGILCSLKILRPFFFIFSCIFIILLKQKEILVKWFKKNSRKQLHARGYVELTDTKKLTPGQIPGDLRQPALCHYHQHRHRHKNHFESQTDMESSEHNNSWEKKVTGILTPPQRHTGTQRKHRAMEEESVTVGELWETTCE